MPVVPKAAAFLPWRDQIWSTKDATDVLPLVPVTATVRDGVEAAHAAQPDQAGPLLQLARLFRDHFRLDEAIDAALCWGWIDGLRKSFDEQSFLQRFTPRRPKSVWSQINRDRVARLIAAGRMTPQGQRQIDVAKADGRWDAAYAPIRSSSESTIPDDLRRAIEANPRALKTFGSLNRMNLFALTFRTNNMKTPAGRARKIASLVAMLARGEVIVPQRAKKKAARD